MPPHEALIGIQSDEWETVPSFELEEDNRNQLHEFRESLEKASMNPHNVLDDSLFDLETQAAAGSPDRPVTATIAAAIKEEILHSGNGLYTSEAFAWLGEAQLTTFDVVRVAKAETSAHKVFFGLMTNPHTGQSLPVAVKPCTDKPSKAYLDWLNNSLVANTGRKHFVPVGFIYDADRAYSLTYINRGVETLDNSEWGNVLQDKDSKAFDGQRGQLNDLAVELADLHEDKIFHIDPEFKNIAIDPLGDTFFIDWESAQVFGPGVSEGKLIEKAVRDLETIYYSAAASESRHGVGLLSHYDRHLQWEHFNNYILTPYLNARLEADSSARAIDIVGSIEERVQEYALKKFASGSIDHFMRTAA